MEGIETNSIESGNAEIGSITGSSGLIDQDGQDGQDGQASQKDIGSRIGGRVSGRTTIQGARTSPRRTRSGKIVKYKDE